MPKTTIALPECSVGVIIRCNSTNWRPNTSSSIQQIVKNDTDTFSHRPMINISLLWKVTGSNAYDSIHVYLVSYLQAIFWQWIYVVFIFWSLSTLSRNAYLYRSFHPSIHARSKNERKFLHLSCIQKDIKYSLMSIYKNWCSVRLLFPQFVFIF